MSTINKTYIFYVTDKTKEANAKRLESLAYQKDFEPIV